MSLSTAAATADYEYVPVRIPPGTDRVTAAVQLSLHAEYGGWELYHRAAARRRHPQGDVAPAPDHREGPPPAPCALDE